jgi:membrane-associated phospholipid phosphatase
MGTLVMLLVVGIPTAHDLIFLWLGLGMAAFSRELPRMARDWLPLVGVLLVYDLLRGVADASGASVRVTPQIRIDAALFGRPVPTVWLQEHLWHGGASLRWWDYATWALHLSHFFFTFIALAVIWVWKREAFRRYATMVWVLALAGFATYVSYPAAPPWLAAQQGEMGRANRIIDIVWHHIPIPRAGAVFEHGRGYANNVAAMPSLHVAYAVLFSLYLWRLLPRIFRPLLAVYPFAMSVTLVYSGEHYVVDCLAGGLYAIVVFVAVSAVLNRLENRRPLVIPELVPVE